MKRKHETHAFIIADLEAYLVSKNKADIKTLGTDGMRSPAIRSSLAFTMERSEAVEWAGQAGIKLVPGKVGVLTLAGLNQILGI